jgi:hypothetical protein
MRIHREFHPDDSACLRALLRLLQHHPTVGDVNAFGSGGEGSAPQRGDGSTSTRSVS